MKFFVFLATLLTATLGQVAYPSTIYGSLKYPVQAVTSHGSPYIGLRRAAVVRTAPVHAAPVHAAPVHAAAPLPAPVPAVPAEHVATPLAAAVAAVPVAAPVSSQYHKQDELGNYEYGYSNVNSAKVESGNAYGGVTGSYSYVDGHGLAQKVDYVADDYGFRAVGTNFPNTAATSGLLVRGKRESNPESNPESKADSSAGIYHRLPYHQGNYGYGYATNSYPYYGYGYNYNGHNNYAHVPSYGYGYASSVVHGRPVQPAYPINHALPARYPVNHALPVQVAAPAHPVSAPVSSHHAAEPVHVAAPAYATAPAAAIAPAYAAAGYVTSVGHNAVPAVPVQDFPLAASAYAVREADLIRVKNNPGHAESYRVY